MLRQVVEAASKTLACEDRLLITREKMEEMEAELAEEARGRAATREQHARQEEADAKEAANQRCAAHSPPQRTRAASAKGVHTDSAGAGGAGGAGGTAGAVAAGAAGAGGQRASSSQLPAQPLAAASSPAVPAATPPAPPPPPPSDHPPPVPAPSHTAEAEAAGARGSATQDKPPAATEKPKHTIKGNLSAFGWKGKSVKKLTAEDAVGSENPTTATPATAAGAAPSPLPAPPVPSISDGKNNSKAASMHGTAQSGPEATTNNDYFCVEVKVTPQSDDSVNAAVAYIKVFVCGCERRCRCIIKILLAISFFNIVMSLCQHTRVLLEINSLESPNLVWGCSGCIFFCVLSNTGTLSHPR
jgi:hypothetical protein